MKTFKVVLKLVSELRATKPPANVNLAKRHAEAMRGRILQVLRSKKETASEKELEKELKKWLESTLNVFPRKEYNGVGQIAFPNTWIMGVLEERSSALKLSKINRKVIKNGLMIRPRLIGLRRNGKPLVDTVIVEDTVVSNDIHGRRVAIKHFEAVMPPAYTETIYINVYTPLISGESLKKLLEYGRLGASRGQGCGEFKLAYFEEVKE